MDESRIRGMSVVGIAEARTLGTVAHVYLDAGLQRVVVFGVHPRDDDAVPILGALEPSDVPAVGLPPLLARLPIEAIRSIGEDAVTVTDASVLQPAGSSENDGGLVAIDALEGLPVVTAAGADVGRVDGVAFDPITFGVTEIEVVHGLIRRRSRLPIALLRRYAGDELVVDDAAAPAAATRPRRRSTSAAPTAPTTGRDRVAGSGNSDDSPSRGKSRKANRLPRSERRAKRRGDAVTGSSPDDEQTT